MTVSDRPATPAAQPGRVGPTHGAGSRYRPDIDGLRALAVTAVVLYHLDVWPVRGGYVGVDVFFVISGYLITGILRSDIERDRYSIASFYDRRIRRIFPALFAMMGATALAAAAFFLPPEITDFARSAVAATLFVSNMHFMAVTDYFNNFTDGNPLLHTWSLAVEEQFYIVFPLLLYGLRRVARLTLLITLGVLGLLSFALSVHLVKTNQIAAFYLAPSRAWELLIGSLLVLRVVPPLRRAWLREAVAALGLLLIVASILKFYAAMPFPGVRALMPCLGAACLIHAGEGGSSRVTRLLSLKPVVFVGLISYSLYLWHWPIIVFARLWWIAPMGALGTVLILGASVAAGTLSWRFVERPFRDRSLLDAPLRLRGAALAAMAGTLAVAGVLLLSDGLARLFPPEVDRLAGFLHYDDRPIYRRGTCFLDSHVDSLANYDPSVCMARTPGRPAVLLIGDSHGAHLWHGLAAALPKADVLQATASGCKPVFDQPGVPTCRALIDRALDTAVTSGTIDAVVLSARWEAADIPALLDTVGRLAPHVRRVFVAGPVVEYRESLPRLLALASLRGSSAPVLDGRLAPQSSTDAQLRAALAGSAATYLSTYRALCPPSGAACATETADGTPVQWDYGHLTAAGAAKVVAAWVAAGQIAVP